jgi:hypothetical protein
MRCSYPELLLWYGVQLKNRTPYGVAPEPQVESENQTESHISLEASLLTFQIKIRKKLVVDDTYSAAPES